MLDLSHDPAFILFIVRGDQHGQEALTLESPKMYTMASRGVRQIVSADEMVRIEEFGKFFLDGIAIPFCNSWPQRRAVDKALRDCSNTSILVSQRIKSRFPTDFEKLLRRLRISASTWPNHPDNNQVLREQQAKPITILQGSHTSRIEKSGTSLSKGWSGRLEPTDFAPGATGGGDIDQLDAPQRNVRSKIVLADSRIMPLLLPRPTEEPPGMEQSTSPPPLGSPLLGLRPTPCRNLGLLARATVGRMDEMRGLPGIQVPMVSSGRRNVSASSTSIGDDSLSDSTVSKPNTRQVASRAAVAHL